MPSKITNSAPGMAAAVAGPPLTSHMTSSALCSTRVGTRSDRSRAVRSPGGQGRNGLAHQAQLIVPAVPGASGPVGAEPLRPVDDLRAAAHHQQHGGRRVTELPVGHLDAGRADIAGRFFARYRVISLTRECGAGTRETSRRRTRACTISAPGSRKKGTQAVRDDKSIGD
jgi:hypothetical protein